MFVEQKYFVSYTDIGKDYLVTNKALLTYLEDTGGIHSNMAGTGVWQIEQTHITWVALYWNLKVFKRPRFAESVIVKTWSALTGDKLYADRDFEVRNESGEIIALATSRWIMINSQTGRIQKLIPELFDKYESEPKRAWENITYPKLIEPERIDLSTTYKINKQLIDYNNHVHNVYYCDLADVGLPDKLYGKFFDNLEIMYKHEIKYGDEVVINYTDENDYKLIVIKSKDNKNLHSIIKLS